MRIRVHITQGLRVGVLTLIYATAARSRSKPIRENQLDMAGSPVGIISLLEHFVLSALLPGMLAPGTASFQALSLRAFTSNFKLSTVNLPCL
jgi:hypothetical protein